MNIGSRDDYIKYRLNRAGESLEEAVLLAENNKWNAVINRQYYACFYAVNALLLQNKIETQTHDGARSQFVLNFIKTGLMDRKQGKLFTKLFDFRQKSDYGDLFDYDAETAQPLIGQVKEFIEEIKKHITQTRD